MISTFLGACQDPTPSPRQSFCNYLYSEIEHLEERDFLTFRNETVKLLSEIQYKAEEHKRQVTTSQQVTTFRLPEATQVTAGCEYILTIRETQAVSIPVQVCYSISRSTHHSHFHPLNFNQHQCHLPLIMNSQDLPASPASRVSSNQPISPLKSHQNRPF